MHITVKSNLKGDQKMGLNYIEVPDYNLYWWLSTLGVSLITPHSEWSWIQAIQIIMVLSATYQLTNLMYPHIPMKKVVIKEEMDIHLLEYHK
eukprot:14718021-Ditylum_brightwellii.AAC.1